jgi:hypothetical protein
MSESGKPRTSGRGAVTRSPMKCKSSTQPITNNNKSIKFYNIERVKQGDSLGQFSDGWV